jgi:RNA polymerase sigma-70 factor (ECF subfamily)
MAAGFKAGEPAAIRAVYERYSAWVYAVAMRTLGDRQLAEDAVQLTFLKAWQAAGSMDETRTLAPWLYTIAHRAAIDLHRIRRKLLYAVPIEDQDYPATLSPQFEHVWEKREIWLAVNTLPPTERDVVAAQYYLGLTQAQIADLLVIPVGTVKSRSHRAHRRLGTRLRHLQAVPPAEPVVDRRAGEDCVAGDRR